MPWTTPANLLGRYPIKTQNGEYSLGYTDYEFVKITPDRQTTIAPNNAPQAQTNIYSSLALNAGPLRHQHDKLQKHRDYSKTQTGEYSPTTKIWIVKTQQNQKHQTTSPQNHTNITSSLTHSITHYKLQDTTTRCWARKMTDLPIDWSSEFIRSDIPEGHFTHEPRAMTL